MQTEKEGEGWDNEGTKDGNGEIESDSRVVGSLILRASDSRIGQSHAIVILGHIQQRVKQDWSFSSCRGEAILNSLKLDDAAFLLSSKGPSLPDREMSTIL